MTTNGPWVTVRAGMDTAVVADHQSAFNLAMVYNGGSDLERDGNARLIAAAPDMLAALRFVRERLVERSESRMKWTQKDQNAYELVNNAISKATGINPEDL